MTRISQFFLPTMEYLEVEVRSPGLATMILRVGPPSELCPSLLRLTAQPCSELPVELPVTLLPEFWDDKPA